MITGWAGPTIAPLPDRRRTSRRGRRRRGRRRRNRGIPLTPLDLRNNAGRLVPVAVLAAIAAAALVGGAALAGSLTGGAGPRALHLNILTQAPLPPAAGVSGAPAVLPGGPPSQPVAVMAPGTVRARNVTLQVSPAATAAPTVTASPGSTGVQQAVVVRYTVVSQWAHGFRAEVDVVNNGSAPVSGWQIVVALPRDQITSFTNASGYLSHHILLLQPAASSPSIAPGGSLRVSLAALGTEITPELCAFDNIACG